ncbi:MAG: DUF1700 domain-containing protein [Bryobacteraceae bacterium]|jgi:hypothetical protein
MATQTDPRSQIERYLLRLRAALGRLPDDEKAEILSDIRNHIEERLSDAAEGQAEIVTETIAALGSPESLAESYHRERLMARASVSAAPTALLHATFQWALTGLRGFLAFLVLLLGYSLGLGFLVCALLKPFLWNHVGLWLDPPAFSLGYISPDWHGARELLGWWIIPIGYTVGPLFLIWTTRLVQCLLRRRSAHSMEAL